MIKQFCEKIKNNTGVSILELLIALFLTGIVAAASFKFYATIHDQSEMQYDLSEIQLICRNSLQELKKNIRMAGYRLDGHDAFAVNGDTLSIYMQKTQPVDTIQYYLQEYEDWEYSQLSEITDSTQYFKLMKKTNSATAEIFADCITNLRFTELDSANIVFSISAQTDSKDHSFKADQGFKNFNLIERVKIRNM